LTCGWWILRGTRFPTGSEGTANAVLTTWSFNHNTESVVWNHMPT